MEAINQPLWCSCLVDRDIARQYVRYFRENDIYFEPSESGILTHFEVLMNDVEMNKFNNWIKEELNL